eukprot:TRINITY_DN1036_c0_g1_i1.p1 TRINITY_DN1036_c0_g1~~TRINITY_DN1036_c0_g1_i1.p1  ORF type:complete len:526 (+),score=134.00 TRINITY_DN1036_c0_g1_i1:438-2015(+)
MPLNLKSFMSCDFQDFGKLIELANKTDSKNSLASLVVNFCESHGNLQPFVQYLLKQELDQTVHPETLFREDSLLVSVLNTIMFGDLGMKYLKMLTKPLVADVVTKSDKGLGVKDGNQENITRLLEILTSFVDRFAATPFSCPLSLREVFCAVQTGVEEKFGSNELTGRAPLVLDLIFFKFICPALVNPSRYDLLPSITPKAQTDLITASKILNDLALNNTDKPWGETINQWIARYHPILAEKIHLLIDKQHIEQHKEVVQSSMMETPVTDIQRRETRENLLDYFLSQNNLEDTKSVQELMSTGETHLQFIQSVASDSGWKVFKEMDGIVMSSDKISSHGTGVYYIKVEVSVKIPHMFVAEHTFPILTVGGCFPSITTRGIFREGLFYITRSRVKLPVVANREALRAGWFYDDENGSRWITSTDVPQCLISTSKGYVRGKTGASTIIIQKSEYGSTITFVVDGTGELGSSWERKLMKKMWCSGATVFKKKLEEGWRNPQTLPTSQEIWFEGDSPENSSLSSRSEEA